MWLKNFKKQNLKSVLLHQEFELMTTFSRRQFSIEHKKANKSDSKKINIPA